MELFPGSLEARVQRARDITYSPLVQIEHLIEQEAEAEKGNWLVGMENRRQAIVLELGKNALHGSL
jgi:hypothetical protein